jgi:dipeptidyl aminopeptidase/acylaminoacyl peptidase
LRETFKSLSIFSAMLLVLLLISSGCVVNIPGCGKRTLPFFKRTTDSLPMPPPSLAGNTIPMTVGGANNVGAVSQKPTVGSTPGTSHPKDQSQLEISMGSGNIPATPVPPTPTATPQDMEEFAYTIIENQNPALWTMNTDGSNSTRLSPAGTSAWYPLWSPNGKLLAFLSNQGETGKVNLFFLKKGEKTAQQLTFYDDMEMPSPGTIKPPISWSPKSDKIAYIYHHQVWQVDVDSQSSNSLFNPSDPSYSVTDIDWAPYRENKSIALLMKEGERSFELWLVNPRLLDRLKLVEIPYAAQDLSWSSDTQHVAYLYNSNYIYTASAETSIPQPLIQNASPQLGPLIRYSPSETGNNLLLLLAKKDLSENDYRVALVNKKSTGSTDAGSLTYLTEPGVTDALWSPDGQKIAYLQTGDLWIMNLDGSNKTKISIAGIQFPDWSRK